MVLTRPRLPFVLCVIPVLKVRNQDSETEGTYLFFIFEYFNNDHLLPPIDIYNTDLLKNPYKMDGICKNELLRDVSHTVAAPVRTVHDPHF